jgi:hypothetical protein
LDLAQQILVLEIIPAQHAQNVSIKSYHSANSSMGLTDITHCSPFTGEGASPQLFLNSLQLIVRRTKAHLGGFCFTPEDTMKLQHKGFKQRKTMCINVREMLPFLQRPFSA